LTLGAALSVLDLAPVPSGSSTREALRRTVDLARHAEAWGYRRYWLAEHHGMPGIASSSPAVLIGQVAAATSAMRVGSGGVMLPNHPPLVVAEQFGMLEAMHPGRIDLGIGRAPGTDQLTAFALRRSVEALSADDFPEQLAALLDFFETIPEERGPEEGGPEEGGPEEGGPDRGDREVRSTGGRPVRRVRAIPAEGNKPEIWLLGSSGYSAQVAGLLGLPFAFAHHFSSDNTEPALELYRRCFRPSEVLDEPYSLIGVAVVCADDSDRAKWLHGSARLSMLRLRRGTPSTLPSPKEAAAHLYTGSEWATVLQATASHVVGDPPSVLQQLADLAARTGVDELMVTTNVFDHADRLRSYELVAAAAGLGGSKVPATRPGPPTRPG
jgi:luciferase family oxidoreductase group 1